MYISKEYAPEYDPNYEYGKKKDGLVIPKFSKVTGRDVKSYNTTRD